MMKSSVTMGGESQTNPYHVADKKQIPAAPTSTSVVYVLASGFQHTQSVPALRNYLEDKLLLTVTVRPEYSGHFHFYSSFLISAVCDNPRVFMEEDLWPEHISVRWFCPDPPNNVNSVTRGAKNNRGRGGRSNRGRRTTTYRRGGYHARRVDFHSEKWESSAVKTRRKKKKGRKRR